MRLLHVINDLDHGGTQTQVRLLATAAVGRGDSVMVASLRYPGPMAEPLRQAGIEVIWLRKRFRFDPFVQMRWLKQLRTWEPNVIQSWDKQSTSFSAAATRDMAHRGKPLIWFHTVRDQASLSKAESSKAKSADVTILSSPATDAESRARIVPNGYDPAIEPVDIVQKQAARQRLRAAGADITDNSPIILAVARLDRPEAMIELIWAADLVRVVAPGLRMLVVGEGPARRACQRFAAEAVEPGLIKWFRTCDDLATLYAAADVVWCGAGSSAAPTPAIEALAAGKPLVIADGPGRNAIVPDAPEVGSAGLRPAWNDRAAWARATKRLFDDLELAGNLGRENAQRAEPYRLDRVSRLHAEALQEALSVSTAS